MNYKIINVSSRINTAKVPKAMAEACSKLGHGLGVFPNGRIISSLLHSHSTRVNEKGWYITKPGDKHYLLMVDYCLAIMKNLPLKNEFGVSYLQRTDNDERMLILGAIDLLVNMKDLTAHKDKLVPLYKSFIPWRDAYDKDPSGEKIGTLIQEWLDSIETIPFERKTGADAIRLLSQYIYLQEHIIKKPKSHLSEALQKFIVNLPEGEMPEDKFKTLVNKYLPESFQVKDVGFLERLHYGWYRRKILAPFYGKDRIMDVLKQNTSLRILVDKEAKDVFEKIVNYICDYLLDNPDEKYRVDIEYDEKNFEEKIQNALFAYCHLKKIDITNYYNPEFWKRDRKFAVESTLSQLAIATSLDLYTKDAEYFFHQSLTDFLLNPDVASLQNSVHFPNNYSDNWVLNHQVNGRSEIPIGMEFDIFLKSGSGHMHRLLKSDAFTLRVKLRDNESIDMTGDYFAFKDITIGIGTNGTIEVQTYLNTDKGYDAYYKTSPLAFLKKP